MKLKFFITLFLFIAITVKVSAQAKNAIGLGVGFNASRENSSGFGGLLQGEIKLSRSVSLVPSIGAEVPYVVYAGLSGRYYFNKIVYATAGGFAHYNDDGGLGGTVGVGFALVSTKRSVFDILLHGDHMENNHIKTPVAGIRLIYSFSFTRLQ